MPDSNAELDAQLDSYAAWNSGKSQHWQTTEDDGLTDHRSEKWSAHLNRWPIYAAATGAALAMATAADANIISSSTVVTASIPRTAGGGFAVSGGGFVGNTASIHIPASLGTATRTLLMTVAYDRNAGTGGAGLVGELGVGVDWFAPFAVKFSRGSTISGPVAGEGGVLHRRTPGGSGGYWSSGVPAFAAFTADGDLGWIEVEWTSTPSNGYPDTLEALGWGINTVPGDPIYAGETAAPEPGTMALSLLALGAAGILAWRKRRSQAA